MVVLQQKILFNFITNEIIIAFEINKPSVMQTATK
jgi:hypothetical protein